MTFKIIKVDGTQVLVARFRDIHGVECVRTSAYIDGPDDIEYYIENDIQFPEIGYAECYVDDFSKESAEFFISYESQKVFPEVIDNQKPDDAGEEEASTPFRR